jgi:hypothetical protein
MTARSPRLFLALSLSITALVYGVFILWGEWEFARLRERFPYESLEERLPTVQPRVTAERLPDSTAERLTLLEDSVEAAQGSYFFSRAYLLQRLHEEKVTLFVNSPGFGVSRTLPFIPSEGRITSRLRADALVPQPTSPADAPGPTDGWSPPPIALDSGGLYQLHREGIVDFAYPVGFGYVKDRRHVTGLQAHRFSSVPGPEEKWEVRRLELVGLLLHDVPVVYVSENLPRMDEVRGGPTRPLDGFEAASLEGLRRGEDIILGGTSGAFRMLGAVRSTRQCVQCHGGERGDLLGAFSYTLRRSERDTTRTPRGK